MSETPKSDAPDTDASATEPVQPTNPLKPGSHVFLVDGSTYIFRAHFAMFKAAQARGRSFTRSDGTPVGAVMTFCNMLWKLLREGLDGAMPTHVAVVFDPKGGNFRNEIYPDYKANRDAPPEELVPQFPLIRDAVRAFGLAPLVEDGFEADDLIATYATAAAKTGADVTIVSGDKDLMQLVGGQIRMYDPMPGNERSIGTDEVEAKFGVGPERVVDVQALAGDSTDNIPGVPGIGIKTASQLIGEFGDLEKLLEGAPTIKQNKRRENLIAFAEQARISYRLAALKRDAPLPVPAEGLGVPEIDAERLIAFSKAMEFRTFTRRVAEAFGVDLDEVEADADLAPMPAASSGAEGGKGANGAAPSAEGTAAPASPAALAAGELAAMRALAVDPAAYEIIREAETLQAWVDEATHQGFVAVDTETTSLDPVSAGLVGVSLALAPGRAAYLPLGHKSDGLALEAADLEQMNTETALAILKPMLEDEGVLKIGQNLKYDYVVFAERGIRLAPLDDTMLMSYALDSGRGGHGMDDLSARHLGHQPISFKDVAGSGKAQVTFDLVPIARAGEYAAEDADVTLRLWRTLKPRLVPERMTTVYQTLERPLVPVLAEMERAGITVDRQVLSRLSGDFAQSMGALEEEIHELAGESFNIASPKQLGEILFDKMSLEGGKKTKTGAWGTGADVLETLAAQGHDLPARVLDWRQLAKLKSTYTDALPGYVNPKTGRVHTSYALASTTTGRLSSSEPNLQNIPVRTPEGRKIRTAFIADKGHRLISADYSQIELRVLAHVAGIDALREAFARGQDIHAMTASEMFGVPIEGMDPSVRRRAKAINFGIIYGISAFGLANQLSIPRGEAKDYIDRYFERFPGIRDYMEDTKAFAREHGFVETVFGRKCHYPEINSKNQAHRAFTERAAINAPIQGSAADIIRRAMIAMPAALEAKGLKARMLLQVHDELIFEAPEAEVEATIAIATEIMENAALPARQLSVPLQVDARAAQNWDEAH